VRVNVFAIAQVLVNNSPFGSIHRRQTYRSLVAQSLLCGFIGLLLKLLTASLTVTSGIDLNADPLTVASVALDNPRRQMLDGVDRLAMLADEEPEVFALERPCYCVIADHDLDLGLEIERLDDLFEQFKRPLLCLFRCCH